MAAPAGARTIGDELALACNWGYRSYFQAAEGDEDHVYGLAQSAWGELYAIAFCGYVCEKAVRFNALMPPNNGHRDWDSTGWAAGVLAACFDPRLPTDVRTSLLRSRFTAAADLLRLAPLFFHHLVVRASHADLQLVERELRNPTIVAHINDGQALGTIQAELNERRARARYVASDMARKLEFHDEPNADGHHAQRLPTALQTYFGTFVSSRISFQEPVDARTPAGGPAQ